MAKISHFFIFLNSPLDKTSKVCYTMKLLKNVITRTLAAEKCFVVLKKHLSVTDKHGR